MRGHHYLAVLLVGLLATGPLFAQEATEKQARKGARAARRGPGRRDPLGNLRVLTKRLKLDANQQAQLKPLLEEYARSAKQIIDKTPQEVRERRRELIKQMREARKDKDKDKTRAIGKELKDLRKNDPQAQELIKLRQALIPKIEAVLRDDQKEAFQKLIRGFGPAKPSLNNPRFLGWCVRELDLRPEQKAELRKIDQEFREAMKDLGEDISREKREELGKQYCQEVMKVLDAAQKQQLPEIAKDMPGRPGMLPVMRNPKLLERALQTIELRADQRSSIDALKERYLTDLRSVKGDRRARMGLNRRLVEDVLKLLDDAQKEQLMKWRPTRKRGRMG